MFSGRERGAIIYIQVYSIIYPFTTFASEFELLAFALKHLSNIYSYPKKVSIIWYKILLFFSLFVLDSVEILFSVQFCSKAKMRYTQIAGAPSNHLCLVVKKEIQKQAVNSKCDTLSIQESCGSYVCTFHYIRIQLFLDGNPKNV